MKKTLRWIAAVVYVDAVVFMFAALCGYPLPPLGWDGVTYMSLGVVSGLCKEMSA